MTLLELLLVIAILGFLAAMVIPFMGLRNNDHLAKLTMERMEAIRDALIGDERAVDPATRQHVIGGYIGDLCSDPRNLGRCDWPSLWEPGGDDIGPAEDQLGAADRGEFDGKRFVWTKDFVEVENAHLESLGQPRGLWTRDLNNDGSLDDIADTRRAPWLGPYLNPPIMRNRAVGRHYAKDQDEYDALSDFDRQQFHLLQGDDQLTDAWNQAFRFFIGPRDPDAEDEDEEAFWIVSHGPDGLATFPDSIEEYDENAAGNEDNLVLKILKRDWRDLVARQTLRSISTERLIQSTEDRIARVVAALIGEAPAGPNTGFTGDLLGWPDLYNWVQRITVTADKTDDDDETLRIDYSVNGSVNGSVNVERGEVFIDVSSLDVTDASVVAGKIAEELNEEEDLSASAPGNEVTVTGADGKCVELSGTGATIGGTTDDLAATYSGEWGHQSGYTYGQPRGLWDKDSAGDLADSTAYGIGWRPGYSDEPYHAVPDGEAEFERLEDEWYQPLHVFKVREDGEEQLLIVSGGPDGWVLMDDDSLDGERLYGSCSGAWDVTHEIGDYSVSAEVNQDNIARLLRRRVWRDGSLHVEKISIDNAKDGPTAGVTKCRLYGVVDDAGTRGDLILQAGDDGDYSEMTGTWEVKIQFNDLTTDRLVSGARYLVCWDDEDGNDVPDHGDPGDPGEQGWWRIFSIYGHPAKQVEHALIPLDADDFNALPRP